MNNQTKRIKIVHFVSGLISGGAEQMIYNYCKAMDAKQYEFIIVYQHEPVLVCKEKFEGLNIKTVRITARSENFIKNIIDGYTIIKKENPDIVHAHMNLMNFCALLPAFMNKTRVRICHSHIAENSRSILYNMLSFICKKASIFFATDYFACGEEAGKFFYGKKLVDKQRIVIIKNAIDFNEYSYDSVLEEKFREKYGLQGKFIIGHIGRFTYQKNHEKLIGIFKQILQKRDDSFLVLIGSGELEDNIKNQVSDYGLEEKVLFLGNTNDTRSAYSAMDIFILPSRYEGLPVVAVEAQVAGLPCLFSSVIDKSCDFTGLIRFVDLEKNDDGWADDIISWFECYNKNYDRSQLRNEYDISEKVGLLQKYYSEALAR